MLSNMERFVDPVFVWRELKKVNVSNPGYVKEQTLKFEVMLLCPCGDHISGRDWPQQSRIMVP